MFVCCSIVCCAPLVVAFSENSTSVYLTAKYRIRDGKTSFLFSYTRVVASDPPRQRLVIAIRTGYIGGSTPLWTESKI